MIVQSRVPDSDPLMIAWKAYQPTEDFQNTKKWAADPQHVDGSLWAAFSAGYAIASVRAERADAERDALADMVERLRKALRGVIKVADRQTIEFDAARAALDSAPQKTSKGDDDRIKCVSCTARIPHDGAKLLIQTARTIVTAELAAKAVPDRGAMVEAMARAACNRHFSEMGWDSTATVLTVESTWQDWIAEARAAFDAIAPHLASLQVRVERVEAERDAIAAENGRLRQAIRAALEIHDA